MENGWNDDLFPVDETVKYYNKVRAAYPNQAMQLFYLDLGHNPRSASTVSTGDVGKLPAAQNAWFGYYLKGEGGEPAEAKGGVTDDHELLPADRGRLRRGTRRVQLGQPGAGRGPLLERRRTDDLGSGHEPGQRVHVRGRSAPRRPRPTTPRRPTYKLAAAPASGFTIDGASTVIAEFSTPGANDQVIARLYDENVSAKTEQLIGRQTYRPLNVGEGFTKQTFQLHPNSWNVPSGHVVKLELLVERLDLRAQQHLAELGSGEEPRTAAADDRRARQRRRPGPGTAGPLPAAGLHARAQRDPGCAGRTGRLERHEPERQRSVHAVLGTDPGGDGADLHARTQERERRLEHRRKRADEPRIHVHARAARRAKGRGPTASPRATKAAASEASAASAEVKVDETAPNAAVGIGRPRARLRGWRRLVQGHGHSVVHRQRRPAAVRRQRRVAASTRARCPRRRRSTPTARTKRAARSPTTSATSPRRAR